MNTGSVVANGIRFAYLEAGVGPLVLCQHGFPDTPHTFDALMARLAEAGFRAVAPWTRGIYPSSEPTNGDYSPLELGRDVLGLLAALGGQVAGIVGHDWGAMSAYAAANLEPGAIPRMVVEAIPHPRAIRMNPALMWRGWHFGFLAIPWVAAGVARVWDFALLRHFHRAWSPGCVHDPALLARFAESYSNPGTVAAALGYYRSMPLTFLGVGGRRRDHEILFARTSVATLCFAGMRDGVFVEADFERSREAFVGEYGLVKLAGAGHSPHLEEAELFLRRTVGFLQAGILET